MANLAERIQRRARTASARMRYRLGLPVSCPRDVTIDPRFRHPIGMSRQSLPPAQYRDLFPETIDPELNEAGRLAQHRFTLLGHAMEHGARIAWSRDPISGQEWPRRFSPDIAYRGPERLGDIKIPWELNKHQYFFTLGKAAWLSGDAGTAIEVVCQIDDWIDDNPYQRGINWISALESGARAISWMMAYPFYADRCDERFRQRFAGSLAQHMLFVEQHLSTGRFTNTHLIGEAAALVAGGLFLECRQSRRWLATGLGLLEQEIGRQVTQDGVYAERSVAYHRFFLDHYYLVAAWLAPNHRCLSPATLATMERMTDVLMHLMFPDGSAPDFGDADDARGLWLRAGCPTDYRGLLALGAVMFGRGDFKAAVGRVPEDVFWLFGPDGVSRFDELAARSADAASVAYPDAGYYVMRAATGSSDPMLVFDCGPLGSGTAGHGHADALSFQLHSGRYPFLVDSGTYTYNFDYAWRDVFRGTRAHNTVIVDGQEQSIPKDRMTWETVAQSRLREWITTRWFDLADGEHDGYCRLPDPVTHRRAVVFFKPDVWVILDDLAARQRHQLDLLLHLRPDCRVTAGSGGQALLMSPDGERLNVAVWAAKHRRVRLEVLHGDHQHPEAWFSPGYGTRVPARALRVRHRFEGECRLLTYCSMAEYARPVVTQEQGGISIRMRRDHGCDWLLYRTDRPCAVDDVRFNGKMLFHRTVRGHSPVVWGSGVRELAVEGHLQVLSPATVDTILLEGDRCEIQIEEQFAKSLHVRAREGVELIVNGRVQLSGVPGLRASMVTV
jgi:uncharacterized heparinase superfamily protein